MKPPGRRPQPVALQPDTATVHLGHPVLDGVARLLLRRPFSYGAALWLTLLLLGFIPGVTTNYEELTFAGHHSGAQLLGIFGVSVLHNIVHLLFGVAGLARVMV